MANIAAHVHARQIQLVLQREGGQLRLMIRDDGCGFNPSLIVAESRYGLLGMRERAEMIGGSVTVESQVGQGTQVCFLYGAIND